MSVKGMAVHIVGMNVHNIGLAMRLIGLAMHMTGWGLHDIIRNEGIHDGTRGADDVTCGAHERTACAW